MTREENIRAILECYFTGFKDKFIDSAIKAICDLESREWIPVSKKMPAITDFYLIQYSRKICRDEMAVAFYSVEEAESDENYTWEFKPICGEYKEVKAWMPLPYPYKEEEK